ncbi:MAG: hypothetical protein HDS65_07830 [Bacteroidales bacterium]|nr:hypothetical protein [Bacteroidales bacterium]
MTHPDINIIIARFLAREATDDEAMLLLEWLKASEDNKIYFREQAEIWHALHPAYSSEEIDLEKARKRLSRKAGVEPGSLRTFFSHFLRAWSRVAAFLLLPLAVVSIYLALRDNDVEEVGVMTLSTAYGCSSHFTLPDGSEVWLNSNSQLSYIPTASACRNVSLSGEGYFNVHSDASHPFNVNSSMLQVTATGTRFNVNAYDTTQSVTLVEGKVDVEVEGQKWVMKPSDHLDLGAAGVSLTENVDVDKYCSWRQGMLIFDEEPLSAICSRLQQLFYVDIELEPKVADKMFHIILNGEDIHEFVYMLQLSKEVSCEFVQDSESTKAPTKIKIGSYRPSVQQ